MNPFEPKEVHDNRPEDDWGTFEDYLSCEIGISDRSIPKYLEYYKMFIDLDGDPIQFIQLNKNRAQSTRRCMVTVLRHAYNFHGKIFPERRFKAWAKRGSKIPRVPRFSNVQIYENLTAIRPGPRTTKANKLRDYAMCAILYYTGIRRVELQHILTKNVVQVDRKTFQRTYPMDKDVQQPTCIRIHVYDPETGMGFKREKPRYVYLPSHMTFWIKRFLQYSPSAEYLFMGRDGPFEEKTITKKVSVLMGLPPHELRHNWYTQFLMLTGGDKTITSKGAGHTNEKSGEPYNHTPEDTISIGTAFEKGINPTQKEVLE